MEQLSTMLSLSVSTKHRLFGTLRSFTCSCWSNRRPLAVLLQIDRRLSAPTENTRFEPSMFLPVVIYASSHTCRTTFFTESECGLQMM